MMRLPTLLSSHYVELQYRAAATGASGIWPEYTELRAPENEHKLWDHLVIMSGFNLDIDFPCEVIQAADLATAPQTVAYPQAPIRYRHYGKIIQEMIDKASAIQGDAGGPDGEEEKEEMTGR